MLIEKGKSYLVTTSEWFMAPNGYQYKSAWGVCDVVKVDEVIGFIPIRPSTNWYLKVGNGDKSIIIAGCHIHYMVECSERPVELAGNYTDKETNIEGPLNKIWFTQ